MAALLIMIILITTTTTTTIIIIIIKIKIIICHKLYVAILLNRSSLWNLSSDMNIN